MKRIRFDHTAWGVLAYTLGVILLGAYVRASFSGDGCGSHWPLCNGEVIPTPKNVKLWVEFSHRVTSGLALLAVIGLVLGAFRSRSKGSPVRLWASSSLLFMMTEALVGAWLVLAGLVARNDSTLRALAMSVHLCNSFLLLASLALAAWFAAGGQRLRLRGQGAVGWALTLGLLGTLILGVSGAVTALGDTLYPSASLAHGLRQDLSPTANFLIKLRLLHPLIAMSVGLYLILAAGLVSYLRPSKAVRRLAGWIGGLFLAQAALGFVNVALLAPIWMQLVHLFFANVLWVVLVLFAGAALAEGVEPVVPREPKEEAPAPAERRAARIADYVALTKPRVISLLLFTTLAAMVIAARGWPGTWLFVAVAVGGYMAAGSANVINMVIDRDIDRSMRRTAKRPTVTEVVPPGHAIAFATALAVGSFLTLWLAANLLAALLAMAGLAFYVVVYTLLLKRRTWHNIVIGGAAGAFPPLVGWAAVQGELNLYAWSLFAIIFVWTPVHFWALALLIKEDYAKAGVPMLPVVLGERVTVVQITLYAVLTALISVLPLVQGNVGRVYLGAAVFLNALLLLRSLSLYQQPDRAHAVSLYKYSMVYLALLFLTMALDRSL